MADKPSYEALERKIRSLEKTKVQDQAERKLAESELASQNRLLRTLLDNLQVGVFMVEAPTGKPLLANSRAIELLGRGISPNANRDNLAKVYQAYKLDSDQLYPKDQMPIVKGMYGESYFVDDMVVVHPDGSQHLLEVHGTPVRNADGEVIASLVSFSDITERKAALAALRNSEEKFRGLVETSSDWIWEVDEKGVYTYASPQVEDILKYTPQEVIGKTPFDLMPPNEAGRVERIFKQLIERGRPIVTLENVNFSKDGRPVILETSGVPVYDDIGRITGYRGVDRDITHRKLAEEQVKASLKEKETLLKELYHRTKNNMQVIKSMINLEMQHIADENMLRIFKNTTNRINSLSLLHEKLYRSKNLYQIDLGEYLLELIDLLAKSHAKGANVKIMPHFDPVTVSIDSAIPCGMIVNELVSNALKHGSGPHRSGEIHIRLKMDQNQMVAIRISDNGVGLPPEFDPRKSNRLGLKLARTLAENQLRGTFEMQSDNGVISLVRFNTRI